MKDHLGLLLSIFRLLDEPLRLLADPEGCFRSVAPQNDDPVFDTVSFSEVPSRLARARGAIETLNSLLEDTLDEAVLAESHKWIKLCRQSADCLRNFVSSDAIADEDIPLKLAKEVVLQKFSSDSAGEVIGYAKLALRLVVKSVWDYPEMCRRGLLPTGSQRQKTLREIETILDTIGSPSAESTHC